MEINKRRQLLAAGGLVAFSAGYSETASRVAGKLLGRDTPKHRTAGDAPSPEYRIDAQGRVELNPAQQVCYSVCLGCTTQCGVRVRLDRATGKVLRVSGNPYSPLSTDPHLPLKTSVRESFWPCHLTVNVVLTVARLRADGATRLPSNLIHPIVCSNLSSALVLEIPGTGNQSASSN